MSQEKVLKERLSKVASTSEKVLFDRFSSPGTFHSSLSDRQFLEFMFRGTQPNQLLLTNAVTQGVQALRPVYNWFKDFLVPIAPNARFNSVAHFLDKGHPLHAKMSDILGQLDTGITHLGGKEISWEDMPFRKLLYRLAQ